MKTLAGKAIAPVLYLLALSPLFFYKNAIMSIILILACLVFLPIVPYSNLKISRKVLPFIFSFVVLSFYLLYYYHSKSPNMISEAFLIFIFPLLSIYVIQTEPFKKNLHKIMLAYCIAIGLLCAFFIGFYIREIPYHHFDWYTARYNLEYNYKIHGTYICLWIAVAVIFLIHYIYSLKIRGVGLKIGIVLLFLLFFSGLVIYNSRNIIGGLIILGIIHAIRMRRHAPLIIKVLGFAAVAAVLLLSQRYIREIQSLNGNSVLNSTRYIITSCSLKTISESGFMGMDYTLIQDKLNECYAPYNNADFKASELNSHNQYLDFFLKGGILLFIAFIATLIVKLRHCIRQKDYLYLSITLLFVISFLTENVLIRQYGIYIYAFCDLLFIGRVWSNQAHTHDEVIKS